MYETNSKISEILLVNQVPAWLLLVFSESVLCKLCECKHVLCASTTVSVTLAMDTTSLGCEAIERALSLSPRGMTSSWRDREPSREQHPSLGRRNGNAD